MCVGGSDTALLQHEWALRRIRRCNNKLGCGFSPAISKRQSWAAYYVKKSECQVTRNGRSSSRSSKAGSSEDAFWCKSPDGMRRPRGGRTPKREQATTSLGHAGWLDRKSHPPLAASRRGWAHDCSRTRADVGELCRQLQSHGCTVPPLSINGFQALERRKGVYLREKWRWGGEGRGGGE